MPRSLRLRIALVVLLGVFLIPFGTSSLRGITHVLTCEERHEVPFTLVVPEGGGRPLIVSSRTFSRDEPEVLCGGLVMNLGAAPAGEGRVTLRLALTNETEHTWHGTVALALGAQRIPVAVGAVPPGRTATDTVTARVDPGTVEVAGSLLIGP